MNRNILVTGGSRGLGLEIVKVLLEKGCSTYIVNRRVSTELEVLTRKYGGKIRVKEFDIAKTEAVKDIIFGDFISLDVKLDGFVNNAAIAYDDLITNANFESLEAMYRVNVFSPMILVKYVIRNMLHNFIKGSIVHISSVSVHTGYKGLSMYASTKGALEAFSKNVAREWGVRGIRSNCVVAGFMETEMSSTLSTEDRNKIYKRTALRMPTNTNSVAETVEFLLSERSRSITGQELFVDSGTI
jgi:3-oxoacyl-[acyl-carrier protein] reductase